VAQQLAWLGAALRPSPRDLGIVTCVPFISEKTPTNRSHAETHSTTLRCKIDFRFEDCELVVGEGGQCWHELFRNPVIASGFPITRREGASAPQGLELPLKLGAELVGTTFLDKFGSDVFLKGFSSMAVMTGQQKDICSWHFLYKDDGSRIRYTDLPAEHAFPGASNVWDLHNARHVVGWSPDTSYNIGTSLFHRGGSYRHLSDG